MYKGFLIDLDGTVYFKGKEIEGSFKFLERLREMEIPFRLITNTTGKTIREMSEMLAGMGLRIDEKVFINPIITANYFLNSNNINSIYFAGSEKIRNQISVKSDDIKNPAYVLLGDIENDCSYEELNKIYNLLENGAELMTTSNSEYYHDMTGKKMDTGAFVKMFEQLTNKKAINIGKPSVLFFEMALKSLNVGKEKVYMAGDDMDTDISGAASVGINSILVKTGKFSETILENSKIKPGKVIGRLYDIIEELEKGDTR